MGSKKFYVIVGTILIFTAGLTIWLFGLANKKLSDSEKFSKEYMALNGKKSTEGVEYLSVNIDRENKIKYIDSEELLHLLNFRTGLVFFCQVDDNTCRNIAETVVDTVAQEDISHVFYFNTKGFLENSEFKVDDKENSDYSESIKILEDYLRAENEKKSLDEKMTIPLLVAVQKGTIEAINMFSDVKDEKLTEEEKSSLGENIRELIVKIQDYSDDVCDETC